MSVVTAVVKWVMLGEEAALRRSASSGIAAANLDRVERAASGDPPSPDVEDNGAPWPWGADVTPTPGGAASQLKSTVRFPAR